MSKIKNAFEKWNDEMARKYDPNSFISKTSFLIRWIQNKRIESALTLLGAKSEHTVLDLGCGPGNLTVRLRGKKIIGIDLSNTMIEEARDRCRAVRSIQIQKGNIESLSFPDSQFDRVVLSEVLEHVQSPLRVLSEIHRVGKPGARVVITIPNEKLINLSKKIVLMFGLKKIISGEYKMSNNMMDEWHQNEIKHEWIVEKLNPKFTLVSMTSIPINILPYHKIFCFHINK